MLGCELPVLEEVEPVEDGLEDDELDDWLPDDEELDDELELELLLELEDELELLDCCDSGVLQPAISDSSDATSKNPETLLIDIGLPRTIPEMYTPF